MYYKIIYVDRENHQDFYSETFETEKELHEKANNEMMKDNWVLFSGKVDIEWNYEKETSIKTITKINQLKKK